VSQLEKRHLDPVETYLYQRTAGKIGRQLITIYRFLGLSEVIHVLNDLHIFMSNFAKTLVLFQKALKSF
jgi:hypothetical protein